MTTDLPDFAGLLGADRVLTGARRTNGYLRDFSSYSPILENAPSTTTVDAVLRPRSVPELAAVVSAAARHRVPMTLRGSGTGNHGQSLPLQQGIVVDVRDIAGVLEVAPGRISVLPGTIMRDAEEAARATGQELAIMPSSYRVATASGFVCGGSAGIGSAAHGDLWDGNVLAVEILTAEENPRLIRLEGIEAFPVLHTYGTVGVVTRIELRLTPARRYEASYAVFEDFTVAAAFAWDLVNSELRTRLVSLQQAPLVTMFEPVADLFRPGAHAVLILAEAARTEELAGFVRVREGMWQLWPEEPHISEFPFSHTILWTKKAEPESSWLQCRYADDRRGFLEQVAAVSTRYPGVLVQHVELTKGLVVKPMGIPMLRGLPDHEGALDELMNYCRSLGMRLHNPHSCVVEEGGFVGEVGALLALKARTDPHHILNPGKLGDSFFTTRPPATRPPAE
jgi:FAD/FMN-containing dehydrogenase